MIIIPKLDWGKWFSLDLSLDLTTFEKLSNLVEIWSNQFRFDNFSKVVKSGRSTIAINDRFDYESIKYPLHKRLFLPEF